MRCARCHERDALLPPEQHAAVPAGMLCRECLNAQLEITLGAVGGLGKVFPGAFPDVLIKLEFLRVEAAQQEPFTTDRDEIERRFKALIRERLPAVSEQSELDLAQPDLERLNPDFYLRWPN